MAILGIDEVGRGPLAGPLVVGGVILPPSEEWDEYEWIGELRDSKKLSEKKRKRLSEQIWKEAPAAALGWVEHDEIDLLGMDGALNLAMVRLVRKIRALHKPFHQIIIDGNQNYLEDTTMGPYVTTVVRGDDLVKEVSAASIIAKVARDEYMVELSREFPEYGFENHKGYGTPQHKEALREFGPCPEHRMSFEPCKKMMGFLRQGGRRKKNTTAIGDRAEMAVCEKLQEEGQRIVVRNFKTRRCEIDIVSVDEARREIYFTEVKYRRNARRGGGFAAITQTKQKQMRFAAEVYMARHKEFREFDPLLAAAEVDGNFEVEDWFILEG